MSEAKEQNIQLEESETEDTLRNKFLVFFLDGQEYAIAIKHVVDIINIQPVTRIPNCPDYICGITNLRGKVIPIVDVRVRFGKPPREYNDRTCIVVVEYEENQVGMVIDQVSEVLTLDDAAIAPPPIFQEDEHARYVQAIGQTPQSVKLILDCPKMLNDQTDVEEQPPEEQEQA